MTRFLRAALAAVALGAIGLASFVLLVDTALQKLDEAGAQHLKLRDEYRTRARDAAHIETLREQRAQLQGMLKEARTLLPNADGTEVRWAPVEASLRAAAAKHKLAGSLRLAGGPSQPGEFYAYREFRVLVSGSFHGAVGFLHSISSGAAEMRMLTRVIVEPTPQGTTLFAAGYAFGFLDEATLMRMRMRMRKTPVKQ